MKVISDNEEKLLSQLDDNIVQLVKDFIKAQAEVNIIIGLECFADGLKLGAKLITEIMEDDENHVFKDL